MSLHRVATPPANRALVLAAATAIAFTPVVVSHGHPTSFDPLPVHATNIHLTSLVSDAEISALIREVNKNLDQLDSLVHTVSSAPGQTLASALTTASGLTDNFWDSLSATSKGNPLLASMVSALRTVTASGLSRLSDTVGSLGDTVSVSAQQTATLVSSALSGSAATVLYAAAHVVNNPASLAGWAGVLNAPFTVAGGLISHGTDALNLLAVNGVSLGKDVITGATQQVANLLSGVGDLFDGARKTIDQTQVNAVLSIAQALVTTPLTVGVTVVNGLTDAVADAATSAVNGLAEGVRRIDHLWVGDGTDAGTVQNIITDIAQKPLDPGSYTGAVEDVVRGVADTVQQVGNTVVATVVPVPFSASATFVTTATKVVNNIADGLATGTVSVLKLAGVNPALANTVYGLVGAVKTAISLAATTTSAALNAVANLAKAALGTPTAPHVPTSLSNTRSALAPTANTTDISAARSVTISGSAVQASVKKAPSTTDASTPKRTAKKTKKADTPAKTGDTSEPATSAGTPKASMLAKSGTEKKSAPSASATKESSPSTAGHPVKGTTDTKPSPKKDSPESGSVKGASNTHKAGASAHKESSSKTHHSE